MKFPLAFVPALLLLLACATGPAPKPTPYTEIHEWEEAMEHYIEPLVNDVQPEELAKEANHVNYPRIRQQTQIALYFFDQGLQQASAFYDEDEEFQQNLKEARAWFGQMEEAAAQSNAAALLQLNGQKDRYCTLCHE